MAVVEGVGKVGREVVGGVGVCLQGVGGGGEEGANGGVHRRVGQTWRGECLVGGVGRE